MDTAPDRESTDELEHPRRDRVGVAIAFCALLISIVALTQDMRTHREDVPRVEADAIASDELSLRTEAANLMLRNSGKRDLEGIGFRVSNADRKRYVAIVTNDPSNPGRVQIRAGGAVIMPLFPCKWALILHPSFKSLNDTKIEFVTGIGDVDIDLPVPFIRTVSQEIPKLATSGAEAYSARCDHSILVDATNTARLNSGWQALFPDTGSR